MLFPVWPRGTTTDDLQGVINRERGVYVSPRFDDTAKASTKCREIQYHPEDIDCIILSTSLHRIAGEILPKDL